MNLFQFTRRARLDLLKIVDEMGDDNPATTELTSAIEARCRLVAEFPDSGRSREDLAPGLRSVLVDPYIVFYLSAADHIQIIRILHGRRDIRAIFRKSHD